MAATKTKSKPAFTAEDLAHWASLARFREALDVARRDCPDHRSFGDPKRRLALGDYLSLFLPGLLSPVARTMRGLGAGYRKSCRFVSAACATGHGFPPDQPSGADAISGESRR